ncbi:MAG: PD-(D/E)XK nuclease family protein [Bacteroidales bacterium]|nr:PD-(D/E)XK nuclease family protein [Bacteroidales bacterium]
MKLLDYHGSHNLKSKFAREFIKAIDAEAFSLEEYEVRKEYKNIDLLVTNSKKQAIIIENKIWAGD